MEQSGDMESGAEGELWGITPVDHADHADHAPVVSLPPVVGRGFLRQ